MRLKYPKTVNFSGHSLRHFRGPSSGMSADFPADIFILILNCRSRVHFCDLPQIVPVTVTHFFTDSSMDCPTECPRIFINLEYKKEKKQKKEKK